MDMLVSLPKLTIEINGTAMSVADGRVLSGLRVQQRLSLPTLCEMTFIDPDGTIATSNQLIIGAELYISIDSQNTSLFQGQITAIEYDYGSSNDRTVRIRGYDNLHQLRKRQPVCAHVEVTLVELARTFSASLGMSVAATESGPVWKKLVQFRQSDLEFMTELSERCGLYFTLRNNVLQFLTLKGFGEPALLALGDSLLEARVVANGDPACHSVTTTGWDPWLAAEHSGYASVARVGRSVTTEIPADSVGGTGERILVDEVVQNASQAEVIAQAELDRRVAGAVVFFGVATGNAQLQPGIPITVSGIADAISGNYVLTAVTHTIDHKHGFLSILETAPPPNSKKKHSTATTVGIVTRVDDPEGLGRIRVKLPNYNNIETDWLQIVAPGAGKDKGIIALNDIGDRVLLVFNHGDPAQAIVLGGLYGSVSPPDAGVVNGAIRRYLFQTPGGQRIKLDDEKDTVAISNGKGTTVSLSPGRAKITNSDGSYIELSREKLTIHSKVKLEIEAPGQAIVMRGQSIDFARA